MTLSRHYQVTKVKRKTEAEMLKNIQVGDVLEFAVELKPVGSNRGQTYATYVTITDVKSEKSIRKSFNQLSFVFSILDFEPWD